MVMRNKFSTGLRAELIPKAQGTVLEVGVGSGLNLPFYSSVVSRVHAVDPSAELLAIARRKTARLRFPVEFHRGSAENLSFEDGSMDTVVMTWTLCSIPEPALGLREIRRVLKPGGRLIFIEHGLSPDAGVRRWQARLNPVWKRIAGGCNLVRKPDDLLVSAGFELAELQLTYLPGPKPFTFTYKGWARPMNAAGPGETNLFVAE